ncbi:MAG: hypothetical protein OEY14_09610, partial [Myxococcales bacterium]|nr:hypothetical protein [Myxococcales bacterium]
TVFLCAMMNSDHIQPSTLLRDERGIAYTEYIIVTLMVSLGGAAAIVSLGLPLLELFHYVSSMILLPIP